MSRNYLYRDNSANIVLVPAKEGNNKVNNLVTSKRTTIQSTNINNGPRNSTAQDFNQYRGHYVPEMHHQSFYYNDFNVTHLGTYSHLSESQSNTYYWNSDYNNVTNTPAYNPDVSLQNTGPNLSSNNIWYPEGQATDIYQNNYINNTCYPVQTEYYEYMTPCYSECCQSITNFHQDSQAPTTNQHGFHTPAPINESFSQINSQRIKNTHLQNNTHKTPPKISVRKDLIPLNLNVKENIAPPAEIKLPKSPKYETNEQPSRKIINATKIKENHLDKNPIKITLKKNVTEADVQNFLDCIKLTSPKKLSDSKMKIPIDQPSNIDRNRSEKVFNSSAKQGKTKKRVLNRFKSEEDYHNERKKIKKTNDQDIQYMNENRENMTRTKYHNSEKEINIKNKHKYKSDKITSSKDIKNKDDSSRLGSNKKLKENNIVKLIEKNKVETVQKNNRKQELLKEIKRLEEKLKEAREANIKSPIKEKSDSEKQHSNTKEITNYSDAKSKKEKCKLKSVVKVSNVFNMGSKDKKKEYVQHKNKYYIIKNNDTTIINTSKYYEPSLNSHNTSDEKRVREKRSAGVKVKYNTKFEKFHKRDQLTITVSTRDDESDDETTKMRNVELINNKLKKTNSDQNVKASKKTQPIKIKNKLNNVMLKEGETREIIDPMDLDTSFLDDINVDEIVESLNFLNDELKNFDSVNNNTPLNCTLINEISKSVKIHTNPDTENSLGPKLSHIDKISENNNSLIEGEYEFSSIMSPVNFNLDLPLDLSTSTKSFDIKYDRAAPKSVEDIELELKQFFESSESEDDDVKNVNTIDLSSKFILSKKVMDNFSKSNTLSPLPFPNISVNKSLSKTNNKNLNNTSPYTKTKQNESEKEYKIETEFLSKSSPYKDIMTCSNYSQDESKPILITDENNEPPLNAVVEKTTSKDEVINLSCNKNDYHKIPAFGDNKAHDLTKKIASPVTKEYRGLGKASNSVNNYINNQNYMFDDPIATDKLLDLLEQDDFEVLEEGLEIPKDVIDKLNTLNQNCDEASNISNAIIIGTETENKNTNIIDLTTSKIQESDTSNLKTNNTITVDEENALNSTTIATETIKSESIPAESTIVRSNTESLPIEDDVREQMESRISSFLKSTCNIEKLIRQGKFSKIYSIRKQCGEVIVAKICRYNHGWEEKIAQEKKLFAMQKDIPKENYNCVWFYDGLGIDESWCYLMEYFPKNLDQALVENKKPFSIELIQRLAKQLVTAVLIVRNNSIVHTDISPRHILLNASNETLKLCGFDECHPIDHSDITPMIGSARYRAPEVILGHSAGPSIDVWATALVLYKMVTKIDMFTATTNNRLLYQQMLKFGMVPKQMLAASKFRSAHFTKNIFIKKSFTKTDFGIERRVHHYDEINPNKKWQILMHKYYFKLYPKIPSSETLLSRLIVILSKMLVIDVSERLAIEFVCIDKFIH